MLGMLITYTVVVGDRTYMRVSNTLARAKELKEEIETSLKFDTLDGARAARLRGRMGFYITGLFSRAIVSMSPGTQSNIAQTGQTIR
eukprot:340784-Amphidinium_carterae.2